MNEIRRRKADLHSFFALLEGLEEYIIFKGEYYKLYVVRGYENIPRYGITIILLDNFEIEGTLYTFSEGITHYRFLTVKEMESLTHKV